MARGLHLRGILVLRHHIVMRLYSTAPNNY